MAQHVHKKAGEFFWVCCSFFHSMFVFPKLLTVRRYHSQGYGRTEQYRSPPRALLLFCFFVGCTVSTARQSHPPPSILLSSSHLVPCATAGCFVGGQFARSYRTYAPMGESGEGEKQRALPSFGAKSALCRVMHVVCQFSCREQHAPSRRSYPRLLCRCRPVFKYHCRRQQHRHTSTTICVQQLSFTLLYVHIAYVSNQRTARHENS